MSTHAHIASSALLLLLAPLFAGCADVAAEGDGLDTAATLLAADDDGAYARTTASDGLRPQTCAEVRAADPEAGDGEYTLFIEGAENAFFSAYCHDMAGEPLEYLTLRQVGQNLNFSQFTTGGWVSGTSVRTNYTKLRIDPATLLVDISDQTFSTSTGAIEGWPTTMPYAVAMDCAGTATSTGRANINLYGTPFVVAPGAFVADGWHYSAGSATYIGLGRAVGLRGGGECGWMMAAPSINSPVGDAGGFQLQLLYAP